MQLSQLGEYNKAIVAALLGILGIIEEFAGASIDGIGERWVTTAIFVILAVLVWAVPNHPGSAHPPSTGIIHPSE